MNPLELNEKSMLKRSPILLALAPEDFEIVYQRSERIVITRDLDGLNNIIFDKGDIGNCMYILIDGIVDIVNIDINGLENEVACHEKTGSYFGEQALFDSLHNRTARAVVISESCILRKIYKKEFVELILARQEGLYERLRDIGREQIKKNSLVFSNFLQGNFKTRIREEKYEQDSIIYKQGDDGDRFYLILNGTAKVYKNKVHIATLIEGNYFGDSALINQQPHQITIKAGLALNVVSVAGAEFIEQYNASCTIRKFLKSMNGFNIFNRNTHGIIYSQHKSHYKNQLSLTTELTYPNGAACSITKVIGKNQIIKIVKQIDARSAEGELLGEEGISLREQDKVKCSYLTPSAPTFYFQNNRLIGAELTAKYAYLDQIVPTIVKQKRIGPFRKALCRSKGHLWIKNQSKDPDDCLIICPCMETSLGELRRLVSFGCESTQQLAQETGVTLGCGFCKEQVADIASSASEMMPIDFIRDSRTENYCNKALNIKYFRFKPKNAPVLSFIPGQHIQIKANIDGKWIQRTYTLTSNAKQKDYYEIAVRRTKNGIFSNWLHDQLSSQPKVLISKPRGQFHINQDTSNPIVCLVAGVGVTPAIAILRYLLSVKHKTQLYIDYSIPRFVDAAYENEFKPISVKWFKLHLRVTERRENKKAYYLESERRKVKGSNRLSEKDIVKINKEYANANFYICGSRSYEEDIKSYLLNCKVDEEKIHSEQFNKSQKCSTELLTGSVLTLSLIMLFFIFSSSTSFSYPELFNTENFKRFFNDFEQFRTNYLAGELTGYSILGLGIFALSISLPRRWTWVRRIDFDSLRTLHVWLGVVALLVLFLHTGFSTGGIYTTLLISCFLGLFVLGAATGISLSLQEYFSYDRLFTFKKWSKRLHIAISWPLPVLIGAHILSTFWF